MAVYNMWGSSWVPEVVPLPVPPPPQLCKKRKLVEITRGIIDSETEVVKRNIMRQQEVAFHEYEDEIKFMRKELTDMEKKLKTQSVHCQNLTQQLFHKNAGYNKKMEEVLSLRSEVVSLREHVNSLSLRVVTAEQEKEDTQTYYTELVKGLQATSANAEEAACFMRFLHKSLIDFQSGQKVDDLIFKTEKICSICLSEPANIIAKPCHHLEWCRGCAIDQFKMNDSAFDVTKTEFLSSSMQQGCPRCKQNVEHLDYVFI